MVGELINDDYRFANVFIPEQKGLWKEFRIALVQGRGILGLSPFIQLE